MDGLASYAAALEARDKSLECAVGKLELAFERESQARMEWDQVAARFMSRSLLGRLRWMVRGR